MMEGVEKEVNVLIVEDDKYISNFICMSLKQEGYHYLKADTGREAIGLSYANNPDVVILDLGLPDMDGMEVIEHIRSNSDKPIIVVSARQEETEKIKALDLGADDYLVKPFHFEELIARIRVMLRRNNGSVSNRIALAELTLDCDTHEVRRGEKRIELSAKEFSILEYMLRNKGIVLSREKLETHIWNYEYQGASNMIDVYIRYLRLKIDKEFEPKLIHTVRGVGYVLREVDA